MNIFHKLALCPVSGYSSHIFSQQAVRRKEIMTCTELYQMKFFAGVFCAFSRFTGLFVSFEGRFMGLAGAKVKNHHLS